MLTHGSLLLTSAAAYIFLYRHTPSSQSRVRRVTHLGTDGVHCQESADPKQASIVLIKVPQLTGAAFADKPRPSDMSLFYPTLLLVSKYVRSHRKKNGTNCVAHNCTILLYSNKLWTQNRYSTADVALQYTVVQAPAHLLIQVFHNLYNTYIHTCRI